MKLCMAQFPPGIAAEIPESQDTKKTCRKKATSGSSFCGLVFYVLA
jgi:hypothetical protein